MADPTPAVETHRELVLANDAIEIEFRWSSEEPVRLARLGVRGAAPELPTTQSLVDIATVSTGRSPVADRLAGGVAGSALRYVSHRESVEGGLRTVVIEQRDERGGLSTESVIELRDGIAAARIRVRITVTGDRRCQLISVVPAALGVALGVAGQDDPSAFVLHSAQSQWIGESQWSSTALRDAGVPELGLAAHETGGRGSASQSTRGLWSTGRAVPVGFLSDTASGAAIGWQIESTAGWRWEVGEHYEGVYLAAGGPCDIDQNWCVELKPGDVYESVWVDLAVAESVDAVAGAFTLLRRATRRPHPDTHDLRVVYNDYMNTLMGDPTTDRLVPLIDNAAEVGAEVFCIDAGWYDDTDGWWMSVGDWQPSTVRFADGLESVLARIRDRGMVPGIWLEPEAVGVNSRASQVFPDEAFMCRGGERIVEQGRLHLDFRHPDVRAHLDETVDRLVGMGIGYFKLDHNTNPLLGTDSDGTDPIEALVAHADAYRAWLTRVLDRHPDVILELCSSGAMRTDWHLLSVAQLQSTSDQQDPAHYPPIAASAPLLMPPEMAGSWAYPQPSMSDAEIAFTLCTGMLGRLYLSGHFDGMSVAQRSLVAEAVAAHKRLRSEVAGGLPLWPLGLGQWSAPWVASAIDTQHGTTYLTLWRREGADDTIEVPLSHLRGQQLAIDTVFPRRQSTWRTVWDAVRGVLTVTANDEAPLAARTFRLTVGAPRQQARVNAAAQTGPVHGGATGMLYGLAAPGVPSDDLITGARPRSLAQKPSGGRQHPGGDADVIAQGFLAAGGTDIQVYVQDALVQWPYEEVGIDAYLDVVRDTVRACDTRDDRDAFVWVPFNEPDWIWYSDWSEGGRDRFLADWDAAYAAIRGVAPDARIAGPNESRYHPQRVRDFLHHARDNGTLPDVMTWHELEPLTIEGFAWHERHFRALEREFGIDPLPVSINEYGNRRDMSVPGQLLQWIDNFETAKADADLAYWTLAGNLDDHAVGANEANGGYWLLHWYASLRGVTVETNVPHREVRDSLRALAALDDRMVTVLVGGSSDIVDLAVDAVPFEGAGRVLVERIAWTGYQGASIGAVVVEDRTVVVGEDRRIDVVLTPEQASDVFRVIVAPDGGGRAATPGGWSKTIGASEAATQSIEILPHGDDPQHYHRTGPWSVRAMPSVDSRVDFTATVPDTGGYELVLRYGTEARPARLSLRVDDRALVIDLPATLERSYAGAVVLPVELEAGPHGISVATSTPAGEALADSDVSLDSIMLRRGGRFSVFKEAALSWLDEGGVREFEGAVAGRAAVALRRDAAARFVVAVPATGTYQLFVEHDSTAVAPRLTVGGRDVALEAVDGGSRATCALPPGVAIIDVVAVEPLLLHGLGVAEDEAGSEQAVHAARELRLDGEASLVEPAAGEPGAVTVGNLGRGSARALLGGIEGAVLVTVLASNAHRLSGHEYNTDAVVRELEIAVGDAVTRIAIPHTVHWASPVEVGAVLEVQPGAEEVVVRATDPEGPSARVAAVTITPRQSRYSEGAGGR